MKITKDQLQFIVDKMPEELDVVEVFDKILLCAKMEQAKKELENGQGIPWEDVKREIGKRDANY